MTIFKKLALSTALALCAVTGASAAETEYSTFFLSNSTENTPGISTGTYAIDSTTGGVQTDAFGNPVVDSSNNPVPAARAAGDSFVDDFLFTIQDAQDLSFFATSKAGSFMGLVLPSVALDTVTVYDLQQGVYVPEFKLDTAVGFYESGLTLLSGAYYLEVTGILVTDGGGYSGVMTTTPAVPEPSSLALMFAGLGAVVTLVRRRKSRA